ncbi:gliding motility-associated lipoprotein GldJ/gliding motility-associated lipoprotein GldJ,TIGR03530 [Mariniphaga anaerophila]|uniref:Gliding motility-associated lipoprotein GldJ/gliding motility-associated lipoprotein GldJ,TIGR03530 n=1 Tax=Mariniphaga anaerophila TaxID=1484053 RepID=A0A1M4Y1F2_9BACT|nr:SUMF1/EgtB/PvdO family nonheme iron enzyme [Mariniphaga anaerophila]SHE99519.1 gliding motility-associated lipoprotein GldJ/gliding motility-associated lipoprotein GldJ,TIGR03530 [Mariniphaga anaerophila]
MKLRTLLLLFLAAFVSGCGLFGGGGRGESSRTTGWEYNAEETGNIPYVSGYEQEPGPGLVFIQGGTFTMGRVEEDVMYRWDNHPRRVTVASFYMDETEVSNQDYREYVHWLNRVYPGDRQKINSALPDTTLWRSELAYNEPYVTNYFRHPAYTDYPVVGVTWEQANAYCEWRTDRVNEQILVSRGVLQHDNAQNGENVFTTNTYLTGLYDGTAGEKPQENPDGTTRRVKWEDGLMLPTYRLPTEAEWEYAAYGLIGNTDGELLTDRKMYPWNGAYLREDSRKEKGRLKANFVRGRGDMMGMAGALNDNADISAPVFSYDPNDYGLYCMSGNVNEWVADVYRPLSFVDVEEFQPFRGNVVTEYRRGADGGFVRDQYGRLVQDTIADYRNFRDGNANSQMVESGNWNSEEGRTTKDMYIQYDGTGNFSSLISDEVRVYKGGSWKDRPYWLVPGTRRYLEQAKAQDDLGFRCAMTRVGSPQGF